MGQYDLFDLFDFLQHIVRQSPVPARFDHGFARAFQSGEKLCEAGGTHALNAGFLEFAPLPVQGAQHTISLVNVDPNVVQGSSFLLVVPNYSETDRLSCYLTPFPHFTSGLP